MPVLPNASIDQHPEYNNPQAGDFLLIYDSTTGVTKKIDASYFLASSPSTNYQWLSNIDYPVDEIVEYQGKWYKSLDNPNEGNVPSVPGSLFWVEVNKSASGFVPYVPGVFTTDEVYVLGDLDGAKQLFRLASATRPYNSTSLLNEYASGDWELMSELGYVGLLKVAHGWAVNDVLTFKDPGGGFVWTKYAIDDSIYGIVRSVLSANLAVVILKGRRLKGFVGLTPGDIYYAQADATISNVPAGDAVFIALSATEVLLFN